MVIIIILLPIGTPWTDVCKKLMTNVLEEENDESKLHGELTVNTATVQLTNEIALYQLNKSLTHYLSMWCISTCI